MAKKNVSGPANKVKGPSKPSGTDSYNNIYILGFCLLCTAAIYIYPALHNQLTNWDDNIYVTENPVITSWSPAIFTARVDANWAPAHQLLLATEYHLFGINPAGYHLTSLLLHLCNVVFVFFVILKLSRKKIVAGLVALFFGIHPMHVEPVVWVSAQKDLLFAFFYLLAMRMYARYQEQKNGAARSGTIYLLLTMLFFIFSCLSKGMGETLPAVFVLMDCLRENNWNWKFIMQSIGKKMIFFLMSVGFGITAYLALKNGGALDIPLNHTFAEQLMFVCYGLVMYVVKFFVPFSPSVLYLYPLKDAAGMYPVIYYLCPVILALSAGLVLWFLIWRKNNRLLNNILLFGLLFFLVNMVLVLQLKTITVVMLAERYTYLSYIGLLFIAAEIFNTFWEKNKQRFKKEIIAGCACVIILFLVIAYNYTPVWYDSITLWTNAIDEYQSTPAKGISTAYNNRGLAYKDLGKQELAIADYTSAIGADPKFNYPYSNRGLAYVAEGKPELAMADFTAAIKLNPQYFGAYYNRGLLYAHNRNQELAIADYDIAINLNPNYADIYNDRGLAYAREGKPELALADYNKAISLIPRFVLPYYNRGLVYTRLGKYDLAIADYNTALNLNPKYTAVYNDRGRTYAKIGKPELAIADYNTAISMNPQFVLPYYNRGLLYAGMGETDRAIADYNKAISLNPQYSDAYHARGLAEEMKGNHEQAQNDFQTAEEIGQSQGK